MGIRRRSIRVPVFMTKPSEAGWFKTADLGVEGEAWCSVGLAWERP